MGAFILRRLIHSVLTIFGVMILTFLLFRVVSGDIAAVFTGQKGTEQGKADWRHRYGYDRPGLLNVHNRLELRDLTTGEKPFFLDDAPKKSTIVDSLSLTPSDTERGCQLGRHVFGLSPQTPVAGLFPDPPRPRRDVPTPPRRDPTVSPAGMTLLLAGGQTLTADLSGVKTCGELIDRINNAQGNKDAQTGRPLVRAGISEWRVGGILDSQFVDHLVKSVTFSAHSLKTNEKLTDIIADRAPRSLALTIPAMVMGWITAMVIACFVAYYHGTLIDKVGVFLSVLGMCVPFLAYMIIGQYLMFQISPVHAFGAEPRGNIYVPIAVMVLAGIGGSVRFYRTVILDETGRDYVRTARAKGASVPSVLFKHVLRNCMLPILTNLILAIPFLIMGSLLVESYFGIPGMGDLLLTSIQDRDEPIINAMVFLTALIYTVGLLLTDISYAVFDPRVRLR